MNPPADIVYLNGQMLPYGEASLPIEDRGTLFGDGVYEVVRYYAGRPFAMDQHVSRLRRSLEAIGIDPLLTDDLPQASDALLAANGLADAKLYWQITRGPATRSHLMPSEPGPSVLMIAYALHRLDPEAEPGEMSAITVPDTRWTECWIKSLMLLPNSLAKTKANQAGCEEAIFVREKTDSESGRSGVAKHVTEGSSTNVFAVIDGVLRTHPADRWILGGVTRDALLKLAAELEIPVQETAFTPDALHSAAEVFACSTTTELIAITQIDGQGIGDGRVGPISKHLHRAFVKQILR